MRYVMRIAESVSHQNFERNLHFRAIGSMSVGVSVHPHQIHISGIPTQSNWHLQSAVTPVPSADEQDFLRETRNPTQCRD